MAMAMRRAAANGFLSLSKRKGNKLCELTGSRFNLRYFSYYINQKSEDGTLLNSLEFVKWHNGGGIFHRSACIDSTVLIETGAVVHSNSVLGADVHIGSGTVVGPFVSIGDLTKVGYNASLSNCSVGISCIIHNGVCIGQDGFGFFC